MDRQLQQLVDEAKAGGPRALRAAARLMSVMTDEPQRLAEMLVGSQDWPQPRMVLGVTGAPGSGKSTLVDGVAAEFRRRWPERRLGVVAVDPSSPFTGGALLGDRVRMMRHATDPGVFVRSLASRGRLGGLALGAKGVVRVMGLIGCDVVIVETVGVGQSEVEIAQHADLTAVVLAPGQGDSIQMLKAGLIEAGDLFVVNKADRQDAARLHQQLLAVLQLGQRTRPDARHGSGIPKSLNGNVHGRHDRDAAERPVYLCSAVHQQGIGELVAGFEQFADQRSAAWQCRRHVQTVDEIRQALLREVAGRVDALIGRMEATDGLLARVLSGEAGINEVADELLRPSTRRQAFGTAAPRLPHSRNNTTSIACEGVRR